MDSIYDWVTVACFFGLLILFIRKNERSVGRILKFGLAAVAFAIANQLGNAGSVIMAWVVIAVGASYGVLLAFDRA